MCKSFICRCITVIQTLNNDKIINKLYYNIVLSTGSVKLTHLSVEILAFYGHSGEADLLSTLSDFADNFLMRQMSNRLPIHLHQDLPILNISHFCRTACINLPHHMN